jgi:hypothetical protein
MLTIITSVYDEIGGSRMAESHVVSALVDKRAEIAGLIRQTEQQLGQFRADLMHLDATLRLFAPDLEPKTIRAKAIRRSDGWFALGEVRRRVLDALRRAARPMRAPEAVSALEYHEVTCDVVVGFIRTGSHGTSLNERDEQLVEDRREAGRFEQAGNVRGTELVDGAIEDGKVGFVVETGRIDDAVDGRTARVLVDCQGPRA